MKETNFEYMTIDEVKEIKLGLEAELGELEEVLETKEAEQEKIRR